MWAALEPGALFLLILLYIWWIRPFFPQFWILLLALVVFTHFRRRQTAAELGFRRAGFRASARQYGAWIAAIGCALVGAAVWWGTVRRISPGWAAANLCLYCVWGLFQQYLLNGYFVNRLERFTRHAPLVAALMFCAIHAPNWFLMLATGPGGYFAAMAYRRHRNLFFLGLAHGVLGFLLYLTVPDSVSRHLYVGPRWFGR